MAYSKRNILILIVSLALSTLIFPASSNAAEYNAYGAVCVSGVGNNSQLTANKRGYYTWVWRTGTTVNGYSVKYLTSGQTWTIPTPYGVISGSRFGVLTTSTTFAYVICS